MYPHWSGKFVASLNRGRIVSRWCLLRQDSARLRAVSFFSENLLVFSPNLQNCNTITRANDLEHKRPTGIYSMWTLVWH